MVAKGLSGGMQRHPCNQLCMSNVIYLLRSVMISLCYPLLCLVFLLYNLICSSNKIVFDGFLKLSPFVLILAQNKRLPPGRPIECLCVYNMRASVSTCESHASHASQYKITFFNENYKTNFCNKVTYLFQRLLHSSEL